MVTLSKVKPRAAAKFSTSVEPSRPLAGSTITKIVGVDTASPSASSANRSHAFLFLHLVAFSRTSIRVVASMAASSILEDDDSPSQALIVASPRTIRANCIAALLERSGWIAFINAAARAAANSSTALSLRLLKRRNASSSGSATLPSADHDSILSSIAFGKTLALNSLLKASARRLTSAAPSEMQSPDAILIAAFFVLSSLVVDDLSVKVATRAASHILNKVVSRASINKRAVATAAATRCSRLKRPRPMRRET
mmetsp:Transcript_2297/g.3054  ORF Transcript_2297/g.3054 Transcript_2297/m.3054 type:complete len:255 (-) Transcript_2297:1023-1787(-)